LESNFCESDRITKKLGSLEELIKKAVDSSQGLENIPPNLRLLFARLDQKVGELEKNLGENKQIEEEAKSPRTQGLEMNSFRGTMAKQEVYINDIALRLSELESNMNKLEPNNIRALIRDIAELVMQEQSKGVAETVDNLKGVGKRNEYLVATLKEELKILDERFKQDIERKIERNDLFLTKTQLQRKVIEHITYSYLY